PEGVFDKLVVEQEKAVLALGSSQSCSAKIVLGEHHSKLQLALIQQAKHLVEKRDVLARVRLADFLPLHFRPEVLLLLRSFQPLNNLVDMAGFDQCTTIEVGEMLAGNI